MTPNADLVGRYEAARTFIVLCQEAGIMRGTRNYLWQGFREEGLIPDRQVGAMTPDADSGRVIPPYFPPQAHAAQMADEIAAFANRYPLMWAATLDKLRDAAESLRWQVRHGYVGGLPPNDSEAMP